MKATLCPTIPMSFEKISRTNEAFVDEEMTTINEFKKREMPIFGVPGESCTTNLFFGFFFDGTKNNYVEAEKSRTHSNIARLYDCYPGNSVPGVLPKEMDWKYRIDDYSNFFKVYIPGVASPFKEVREFGSSTLGATSGRGGEARIIWALLQAINNVHRYFHKSSMITSSEALEIIRATNLLPLTRRDMAPAALMGLTGSTPTLSFTNTRDRFVQILKRLNAATALHQPNAATGGRPKKIDPGIVKKIHISIFGFSRGATQARAFANWLMALCTLDSFEAGHAGQPSLGGFPVEFDFMGLFDTVASIGAGNTLGNTMPGKHLDGHGGWADSDGALRIPEGLRCVHLVAAHEIRRSFPVDSVAVGNTMPPNCEEVVFPGVHSDIGCGYAPREQGRGTELDGADMMTRVPLIYMYRAARLAGVPLKLEEASEVAQARFKIQTSTISALNAYLAACKVKTGTITAIMREQTRLHIEWRLARRASGRTPLEATPSFMRACRFDQNDLHSANLEFEAEVKLFEEWLANKGKGFVPAPQRAGFDNEHLNEWEEIASWWHQPRIASDAVLLFFDDFVHDSRAWFKMSLSECDNEADLIKQLKRWALAGEVEIQADAAIANHTALNPAANSVPAYLKLSPEQRRAAEEYARTGVIPRMINTGREPYGYAKAGQSRAGYLRFRKVYGGGDKMLLSELGEKEASATQTG